MVATHNSPRYELTILLLLSIVLSLAFYVYSPMLYLQNAGMVAVLLTAGYIVYQYRAFRLGNLSPKAGIFAAVVVISCFLFSALTLIGMLQFIDTGLVAESIQMELNSLNKEAAAFSNKGLAVEIDYDAEATKIRSRFEPLNILKRFFFTSSLIALLVFFISPSIKKS